MHRSMPYRAWLLLLVAAAVGASAIAPFDRRDWVLEHLPTAAAMLFLWWSERRPGGRPLSKTAYTLVFVFTLLHVVGAHHLYSRVPYVQWFEAVTGSPWPWPSERNHYDRFVHLCFGLLVTLPIAELVHGRVTRTRGWAVAVAILFVALTSKLYELAEWAIAITLSPEQAEAYNGQQGDMFDAQKDMALAFGGSLASSGFAWWRLRRIDEGEGGGGAGT